MKSMKQIVEIDNIILTCDVHSYIKKSPDFNTLDSDWDAIGYEELDWDVDSILAVDEDDLPYDLSLVEIDRLLNDRWFMEKVEKELIKIIEAEKEKGE